MPDPQSASAQDEPLPQTVTLADLPADIQLVLPIDNAPSAIARLAFGVLLLSAPFSGGCWMTPVRCK